jgi:hypothetical protein
MHLLCALTLLRRPAAAGIRRYRRLASGPWMVTLSG